MWEYIGPSAIAFLQSTSLCDGSDSDGRHLTVSLLETNISLYQGTFEDDFSFLQVGYVSSLEGKPRRYWMLLGLELIHALRRCAHGKKIRHQAWSDVLNQYGYFETF